MGKAVGGLFKGITKAVGGLVGGLTGAQQAGGGGGASPAAVAASQETKASDPNSIEQERLKNIGRAALISAGNQTGQLGNSVGRGSLLTR